MWDVESKGHNHANRNGTNEWRAAPDRDHSYLIEKMPPADVAALIEKLMLQPPAVSGTKEK